MWMAVRGEGFWFTPEGFGAGGRRFESASVLSALFSLLFFIFIFGEGDEMAGGACYSERIFHPVSQCRTEKLVHREEVVIIGSSKAVA